MKSVDDVNAVMADAGPLDDAIVSVARTADDRWVVQFDAVDVHVEYDEATGRVMLSAVIGLVPPLRTAAVYEALLSYSSLWRETGGVHMALNGPGGDVMQMVDLPASELRPDILVTVAVNLAERTLIWRGFFEDDGADAPPPPGTESAPFDFIRV